MLCRVKDDSGDNRLQKVRLKIMNDVSFVTGFVSGQSLSVSG